MCGLAERSGRQEAGRKPGAAQHSRRTSWSNAMTDFWQPTSPLTAVRPVRVFASSATRCNPAEWSTGGAMPNGNDRDDAPVAGQRCPAAFRCVATASAERRRRSRRSARLPGGRINRVNRRALALHSDGDELASSPDVDARVPGCHSRYCSMSQSRAGGTAIEGPERSPDIPLIGVGYSGVRDGRDPPAIGVNGVGIAQRITCSHPRPERAR